MNFSISTLLVGAILLIVQLILALPWVGIAFLTRNDWDELRKNPFPTWLVQRIVAALVLCFVIPPFYLQVVQNKASLEVTGQTYAAILQLQITIDLFIFGFMVLLALWPKGGAVGLAAFRESVRQPMFWLLTVVGALLMFVSIFVPYFTFGEDYLMVKQLGYDTIMLAAVLFGGLGASLSISEEIEGRAAITVMSKPVSRRQFMLGKFAGIILAALFMFGALGVVFEGVLMMKHWWDRLETTENPMTPSVIYVGVTNPPAWVATTIQSLGLTGRLNDVLTGIAQWTTHMVDTLPGLILCYSQVMVLVGLSVALATRVPMVVNLVSVVVVFFLAHLTPVLVALARRSELNQTNSPVAKLVGFVAGVFDTILPDLGSFSMDPALLSDAPPPAAVFAQYVGSVTLYGVVYTAIVLLFGLILFEDRDLA